MATDDERALNARLAEARDCRHHATVTAPMHVVLGQQHWTTGPATRCVTCHIIAPPPPEPEEAE